MCGRMRAWAERMAWKSGAMPEGDCWLGVVVIERIIAHLRSGASVARRGEMQIPRPAQTSGTQEARRMAAPFAKAQGGMTANVFFNELLRAENARGGRVQ